MNTCSSSKSNSLMSKLSNEKSTIEVTNCLNEGTCSVKILKNKTFTVEKDGIGVLYPVIVDGDNIVIQYTYKIDNPNDYVDGGSSETIHFEISNNDITKLVDNELQEVKLLFGKHCYCKGLAGFYKVNKGTFLLSKNKNELSIQFEVPKVGAQQIIKNITLKME